MNQLVPSGHPAAPLFAAVEAGRLDEVRALLDAGADANSFVLHDADDPNSKLSVLYRASIADSPQAPAIVRLLLERGAEPNDGESIYHAAELDRREVLEALVAGGADPSGRHAHWKNTPLYFLAGYHHDDPDRFRATRGMSWLLEHGADPNVTSSERAETPLHRFAAEGRENEALAVLLDHGAKVDARRTDGRTPYALAVRGGWADSAAFLVSRGAQPEASDEDRFVGAGLRGDLEAARALLSTEPELRDVLSRDGEWAGTPLHWAAWHGRPAGARALVELGAPVNYRDREFGSSPIAWACHGSTNCRKPGAPGDESADADYVSVVEILLDAGSEREPSINNWGNTPESMARPAVAEVLRRRGFVTDPPSP